MLYTVARTAYGKTTTNSKYYKEKIVLFHELFQLKVTCSYPQKIKLNDVGIFNHGR